MAGPDFAPCPTSLPPGTVRRRSVKVVIHGVRLNSDMEGDDDYVPFYDNRADVYGRVTIDGTSFDLPEVPDNDRPFWDPERATFVADISQNPVPISIELYEADAGITGDDDTIDINPRDGKATVDFTFDTCSLRLGGELSGSSQQPIVVSGTGENGGTLTFSVGMVDGAPDTVDDVALVEIGLVQVIHGASRLVAGKPTVLMARVANNASVPVKTALRVRIFGRGVEVGKVFPLELEANEVRKEYFLQDDPLILPHPGDDYDLNVVATVDDPFSKGLPQGDCRRQNDGVDKPVPIRVVATRMPRLLWTKVGSGLDIGQLVPDDHFEDIKELGSAYIDATYPVAGIDWDVNPFPIVPPLSAVHDWMTAILSFLPVAKSLDPFALVFELNLISILSGTQAPTILGVLPTHDWFARFDRWEDVSGVSMGDFAPYAVIFQPRSGDTPGPQMTLPAHELGHTFNLSVDSRLKHSWVCGVDWPVVGSLPCGAAGGLDEYWHTDPDLKKGDPASGYWVRQPGEPASISTISNAEMCNSHCFMGRSPVNAHQDWAAKHRWIDRADYEALIGRLASGGGSGSLARRGHALFVSGMIAWNDEMHLGPVLVREGTEARLDGDRGLYAVRSLDKRGTTLAEVGIPIDWNIADFEGAFPVTAFATTVPLPQNAHEIEFVNRGTGKRLAEQKLIRSNGLVAVSEPSDGIEVSRGEPLRLRWEVRGGTGSPTRAIVLVGPGKDRWWPASATFTGDAHSLDTSLLEPGIYEYRVSIVDGVDVISSPTRRFRVRPTGRR